MTVSKTKRSNEISRYSCLYELFRDTFPVEERFAHTRIVLSFITEFIAYPLFPLILTTETRVRVWGNKWIESATPGKTLCAWYGFNQLFFIQKLKKFFVPFFFEGSLRLMYKHYQTRDGVLCLIKRGLKLVLPGWTRQTLESIVFLYDEEDYTEQNSALFTKRKCQF